MNNATILVTGATGATGGSTIDNLLASGHKVRALVRADDARAQKLRDFGVEIAVGDLLDIDSIRRALEGVHAAYFVYPLAPQILAGTVNFAQAAIEAGVSAIVNLSQMTSRRDSMSHAAKDHWLAEQVLIWCGVPVTILRPTLFAEWLLYPFSWKDYGRKDTLTLPFGTGRFAPIAAEDQGRVIAAILAEPAPHASQLYRLLGRAEMDGFELAAAVSEVVGRSITYCPVAVEDFLESMKKVPGYGSPFFLQHIGAVAIDAQNGITGGTNNVVETITGMPPMSVRDYVVKHRAAFEPS